MTKTGTAVVAGVTALLVALAVVLSPVMFILGLAGGSPAQAGSACLIGGTGSSTGWTNPMEGPVTSEFGPRTLPNGDASNHDGIDIDGGDEGAPFYSASSGIVTAAYGTGGAEGSGDGGHGIIVDAGDGVEIWYWHAAAGTTKVRAGDTVTPGQELAGMGNTGNSFGAHLHFQINVNGAPVDPKPFMTARGITLGQGQPTNVTAATPGSTSRATDGTSLAASTPAASGPARPADTAENTTGSPAVSGTYTRADGVDVVLTAEQLANLQTVIQVGRDEQIPDKGILIALVTVLQESTGFMYANEAVPASLDLPHDRVGADHDSVGLFQQRPAWGSTADLMDPAVSARKFWGINPPGTGPWPPGLKDVPQWENMSVNDAAQTVQVSAVPDAYGRWEPVARQLLTGAGGTSVPCTPGQEFGAGQPLPGADDAQRTRDAIVDAAASGVGGTYRAGGADFKDWDAAGYVHWVMSEAGVRGFPTTSQWDAGVSTSNPQPGDLVVQSPDGAGGWNHVGIYAGNGQMYSTLNADTGTIEHPVEWGTGTSYFSIVDDQ